MFHCVCVVTSPVTMQVGDVGHRTLFIYQVWSSQALPSKDIPDFQSVLSSLVILTFELLTLELVRNVTRGTDNLPANFGASATFLCRVMGKRVKLMTWCYNLDLWPLRSLHISVMQVIMGFLPVNFQLAAHFHSRLSIMHRTDRQTDRWRPSKLNAPTLLGRGINIWVSICRW